MSLFFITESQIGNIHASNWIKKGLFSYKIYLRRLFASTSECHHRAERYSNTSRHPLDYNSWWGGCCSPRPGDATPHHPLESSRASHPHRPLCRTTWPREWAWRGRHQRCTWWRSESYRPDMWWRLLCHVLQLNTNNETTKQRYKQKKDNNSVKSKWVALDKVKVVTSGYKILYFGSVEYIAWGEEDSHFVKYVVATPPPPFYKESCLSMSQWNGIGVIFCCFLFFVFI